MKRISKKDIIFEKASHEYEDSLDSNYKKNNGIFYTDMELANAIIKFLRIPKESRVIDPNCGSGSFLTAFKNARIENCIGVDFDMKTVQKCKEITGYDEVFVMDTLGHTGEEILSTIGCNKFDYVIGNPPYAPINGDTHLNSSYDFYRKVQDAGKNLFVAAIYRAFEIAKDDGFVSFIVPKNLLHISSYKNLREELLNEKRLISIIELGIHFKAVRGEQVVLTFQNSYSKNNKIKFYDYNNGIIKFLSEIPQNYYKNEIIVFTSNDEVEIYDKLRTSYGTLKDVCVKNIHRGRNKEPNAIRGKQIRKFGFKDCKIPENGTKIFIQNIFSAEAGITASFAGELDPAETVTILQLENKRMSKYILGLLHSRVCNYFLIRFAFNNSRLTIHTDAKYLNRIPIVVDENMFDEIIGIVEKMEKVSYMKKKWFELNETLNSMVYDIYKLSNEEQEYIEREMRKISAEKWYNTEMYSA